MLNTIQNKISQVPSEFAYKVARVKYAENLPTLAPHDQFIVDALNTEGVCVTSLENLMFAYTPQLLNAARSLVFTGVDNEYVSNYAVQGSAKIVTLTDYPDFFLWGLEERLLDIVENYIGLPIAYHGVNFRSDVGNEEQVSTQLWHRDGEDRRIVKIIIYLNDVSDDNGPFEYIPKPLTPSYLSFKHIYRKILRTGFSDISNEELEKISPKLSWKSCLGPAGTVTFVDTRSVFHRGKPPKAERAALFFIYTSRYPTRPDICKANFDFDKNRLIALASQLPQRQRECIWAQR